MRPRLRSYARRSLEFHTRTGLMSSRSVRHLACVQMPAFSRPFLLTGSVEDSSTKTAEADTCLPVSGLKKGRQTAGRVRAAGIAGDAFPAAAPASASASTFATPPTSPPVLPARSCNSMGRGVSRLTGIGSGVSNSNTSPHSPDPTAAHGDTSSKR
ncbi:hypothetical protein EDB89DRAFT_2041256 [Lactarius sanguifluus]|nr:hypothetical protein EDB89DRAFT_2041256 [Lactarius sanguifluus]